MNYEELLTEADQNGIDVIDYDFISTNIKGLYCDGTVALNRAATETEKTCTLAEELGHHYTTSGIIIDQTSTSNRKQELTARKWAYEKIAPLDKIVAAIDSGCDEVWSLAEQFDVDEDFMREALKHYGILDM